ncbi:GGDEF domain-containing protein [Sphingorhabdus sp.]|uniref:GGDEF domain-containing protein n=1 Tax=Sphingorhabdus sp. TaxID=1902408 RepID=UPI003BAFFDF2|nr:diguanylate cyclase [Sphingomonadales bacterium]
MTALRTMRAALNMPVPYAIRQKLVLEQFDRVGALIPVLYLTVAVMAIGAGVAAQGDFPLVYKSVLPTLLVGTAVVRYLQWRSRSKRKTTFEQARRYLRGVTIMAITISVFASLWAVSAYYQTHETRRVLAGLFMTLSSFAVASCLASHPRAANATVVIGSTPVSIAMLTSQDLGIQAAGMCIVVVSFLQIHLVISKYNEMVRALTYQHEMQYLANTDPLTDLVNRRVFAARLEEAVQSEDDRPFAIAMLDLDGFKPANDRYGHAVGDEILVEIAHRLKALCRNAQCVARLGGDEFAVLFPRGFDVELVDDHVQAIRAILALPYAVSRKVKGITASVGVAFHPQSGGTVSDLMHVADQCLYAEKTLRKSQRSVSSVR